MTSKTTLILAQKISSHLQNRNAHTHTHNGVKKWWAMYI